MPLIPLCYLGPTSLGPLKASVKGVGVSFLVHGLTLPRSRMLKLRSLTTCPPRGRVEPPITLHVPPCVAKSRKQSLVLTLPSDGGKLPTLSMKLKLAPLSYTTLVVMGYEQETFTLCALLKLPTKCGKAW